MKTLDSFLKSELNRLRTLNLDRTMRVVGGQPGPEIEIDGRKVIQFASNDYLGMSTHPRVLEGARDALKRYGAGVASSRLISGNIVLHEQLEMEIATWLGCESALVFTTGTMANHGVLAGLLEQKDVAYLDKQCHASIYDAVSISGAVLKRHKHLDNDQLSALLRASAPGGRKIVATEGIFSMDGDRGDIRQLSKVAGRHGAWLLVDEAHALGVLGETGAGGVEAAGLDSGDVEFRVGTFSKSVGSLGGFVAGSRNLRQVLINRSRSQIFATGLNPPAAGAALESIRIIRKEGQRRLQLWENRDMLMSGLKALGLDTLNSSSPIIPVIMGTPEQALDAQRYLWRKGILAPAIRPPSVTKNSCRLRLTVTSEHKARHLDAILQALKQYKDGKP